MTTMDFREKMVQLLKDIMPLFTFEEQVDHLIANGHFCTVGKPYYGKTWLAYRQKPEEVQK